MQLCLNYVCLQAGDEGDNRTALRSRHLERTLTKIKAIGPQALFYSGGLQAGVKVAKQSYEITPQKIKGGAGGLYGGGFIEQVGFPAAEGWYVALTSPHLEGDTIATWQARYQQRWGMPPIDYSVTAYDAVQVILDAIRRVASSGKTIDLHTVRDAIEATSRATSNSTRMGTLSIARSESSRSGRTRHTRTMTRSTSSST